VTRLAFHDEAAWAAAAGRAVHHVRGGGLLGYPTETVYGLGCALDPAPLARLAALKRADRARPFLVLASRAAQLPRLHWTPAATRLARAFWPGPLTIVLAAVDPLPPELRAEDDTVAVRISPHPGVRALLDALDAPITSTSANPPGGTPARTAAAAEAAIASLGGGPDWLMLDGGPLAPSAPSTIVRCVGDDVLVIRPGTIPSATLRTVLLETDART
jgi:L-threonylcarbamoyladenylate synthase